MLIQLSNLKRIIASILVSAFCLYNTSLAVYATEINQTGVPFQTATTINQNGNIFNISTTTTNSAGNVGVNSFGKFNVSNGDTVNMNLINAQNKLVNLIFDSSASQINGIVNSYMNGQIGGNVLFANPNGFVVGETGVFNVGSLTLITPTENFMKSIFGEDATNVKIEDTNLNSLISFNMNGTDYMLLGGGTKAAIKLNPAEITINGTINSGSGIDIITGGSGLNENNESVKNININNGAKLNANMDFTVTDGKVTAKPKTNVTRTEIELVPQEDEEIPDEDDESEQPKLQQQYKLSMDGGNNITIVSSNRRENKDYMSAIVNLDGAINTNGSDFYAQSEVYNTSWKEDNSNSEVHVKGNADIKAHNINLNAVSYAATADHDILGIRERTDDEGILGYLLDNFLDPRSWAEAIVDNFVHLADQKTKVTVESGAKLDAANDIKIVSITDMPISAMSVMETFDLNYTDIETETESIIKSGANVKAGKDLTVQALTKINLSDSTKSTNLAEILADNVFQKTFGHYGAYAVSITVVDAINRAVIEQGANIDVNNNLNVLASMTRDVTLQTQNGFVPIFDKNRGVAGIGVAVAVVDSTNEAIMNANVGTEEKQLNGSLTVNADYAGKLSSSVVASSGSQGEGGEFGGGGKFVAGLVKYVLFGWIKGWSDKVFNHLGTDGKNRLDATFGKIHVAGALNVAVDDAKNKASIGDAEKGIKPVIYAKNVTVNSTFVDHKSNIYAQSATQNGATSVAGAIAVNCKNIDSDAKVYSDMTLSGGDNGQALIIRSKTQVERPSALDSLRSFLDYIGVLKYLDFLQNEKIKDDDPTLTVGSSNVDDYLSTYGLSDNMQEDIDNSDTIFNLLKIFDYLNFHDLNMHSFFNTFAASQATAADKSGKTSAWAGAVTAAIYNTSANAELVGNSIVRLTGDNASKNNILIKTDTDSTMWAAATLSNLFNVTTLLGGTAARDGDSAGGAISVQWGNLDTTAKIGEGVKVIVEEGAAAGDLQVLANENGQFINIGMGNSGADESTLGGTIVATILANGDTKASIEKNTEISVKDAKVEAKKDDNVYHAVIAYTSGQDAKSFGVSSIVISNLVDAYIAGNLNALGRVDVIGDYDKMFLNTTINASIAKSGESKVESNKILEPGEADDEMPLSLTEFMADEGMNFDNVKSIKQATEILNKMDNMKVAQPDKKTSAYAGNILVNIADNDVKAHIDDGAKVKAGNDINVSATSEDMNIEIGSILSANGKSGGGATATFNLNKNDIQSYIGAAEVDSAKDINVKAEEENKIVAVSAGIGQAKDSSGAGAVSLDIQRNEITAAIKDGAKINKNVDNDNQSVSVGAKFVNKLVKAVGALSIQAGGSGEGGAKGATIDGDVAVNNVKAYIKGAEVNASKKLDVKAEQETRLIDISAAGAVSTSGGAYDGTLAAYVSAGDTSAYIENTNINQQEGRVNKGVVTNVLASNMYDNITVTGTVAGGNSNAVGGSMRVDCISDNIDSHIKDSFLDSTGSLTMRNNSILDSVAITVAGSLSTGANAISGAVMLVINDTDQDNYIDNSTIVAQSLTMDSDSKFKTVGVTGGATVATQGNAVGGSIYTSISDNDIDTYIKNSNVTSTNDITLTSDYNIDTLSIIFAGSGGQGLAASGAVSTSVNNSNSNTYIKSEAGKKNNITSQNGKVTVKGTNDIDIDTINGSIAVSLGSEAIGASINTVVDNNDLAAGIEGINLSTKGDVDIAATSTEDIMAISIGGAGGSGITAAGSINTIVMASDIDGYIKDSVVSSTDGDVKVDASGDSKITGGTGSLSISLSSVALGASIVTGVINNTVRAAVENSGIDAKKDVIVSAKANETIGTSDKPFITVAGGFSQGLTIEGVVDTMVMNSTADAHITGTKTIDETLYGVKAGNDVQIKAEGKDTIYGAGGAVGASTAVGVGATVNTVVIDKDTLAKAENTKIEAKNIKASATEEDKFFTTVVAAAGAGAVGGAGVVNTNVITSDVQSGYKNSTLIAENNIEAKTNVTADMQTITGAVGGAGAVGIGLSAVNDIIKYRASAVADSVTSIFKKMDVESIANSTYKFSTVSGAGGGVAGGAGVENVNSINNEVKAYATGNLTGEDIDVKANDTVTFNDSYSGVIAGGGVAGIGATVEVNSITSTILAYIGGDITADKVNVEAKGLQTFDGIVAAGFAGGGAVAGAGTALANLVETTVKAYVADNSTIRNKDGNVDKAATAITLNAENTFDLTEFVGSAAISLAAGVGATVGVNKIKNTVESYTGNDVNINAKDVTISAKSENSIGKSDTAKLTLVAGGAGIAAGVAGTVLYNSVEDTVAAYVGNSNSINVADDGKLDIKAEDITRIYETLGTAGAGLFGGLGASVGYNSIENSVLSYIGTLSNINAENADVSIQASSNETVNGIAAVVSAAGTAALSGGVLYSTIGKKKENAAYNTLNASDKQVFNSAKTQSDNILNKGNEKISSAGTSYTRAYNDAINKAKSESKSDSEIKAGAAENLFAKSTSSGSSLPGSAQNRLKTTSAFVDSGATINARNLLVKANNENNVHDRTVGAAIGWASVGVAAAVSDNQTTTNAFVSNNSSINANSFELAASSSDTQDIETTAATGGIVFGGSGSVAIVNSDKTTNTYILGDSTINTKQNTSITTSSTSDIKTKANAGSVSGISVGVSIADARSTGSSRIDIGDNVTLNSNNNNNESPQGTVTINAQSNEKVNAQSWAVTGGFISGTGAKAYSKAGKDTTVNIGKNLVANVKKALNIKSNAKNDSYAETTGRAYGIASAGGTRTDAEIDQKSGIVIADADSAKEITAGYVDIASKTDNKAEGKTLAGAGAALGISGSGVYTNIKSNNNVSVGKNYDITTAEGGYSVVADTINKYKSFNDGSAYGVVAAGIPMIENTVSSTVNAASNANIVSNANIIVKAANEISKASVSNYDLYAGAGGLASGAGGWIKDFLAMATITTFGGDSAQAKGAYGKGAVDISSLNIANINEKASLYSYGGIAGADTDSKVQLTTSAATNILNKDVKTKDDHINYVARNDVDIYTKANVESYGGVAGAGGNSSAVSSSQIATVNINEGVNSRSGRDTNIKALNNKTLYSYIYARTRGLISVLNDQSNAHNYNSNSTVNIANGSKINALDAINLEASNSSGGITANRNSKAYELGFIEYKGKGRKYTTNNAISNIMLNGDLESGLGSNKKLTINKDGTYISENDAILLSKEKIGEITAADIQTDIEAYEQNKQVHTAQYNAYVAAQNNQKTNYQTAYNNAENAVKDLQNANIDLQNNINDAQDKIIAFTTEKNTINTALTDYNNIHDGNYTAFISKYEGSSFTSIKELVKVLKGESSQYDINTCITHMQARILFIDGVDGIAGLNTQIEGYNSQITTNNNQIATNMQTMEASTSAINAINADMLAKQAEYDENIAAIDAQIDTLMVKKQETSESPIPVYAMKVEDVIVRSGNTSIIGNVTGSGSIKATGNDYSIEIVNNSPSNVEYGSLIIDRNLKSGINVSGSIASSINRTVKNTDHAPVISILNSVDKNDPTVNIDMDSNAGDIVLGKNVENLAGTFDITNYTGDVVTQGDISVKNLHIKVPNGGYNQQYIDTEQKLGGTSGTGAIVAAGNIDISAKTIDVNGLIQSGTEIKEVEIPDFTVIKKDDGKYYQIVSGVETEMKPSETTDGYYYITTTSDTSDLATLKQIKAYFKPNNDGTDNNVQGDIYLFKADTQAGNITLTGNIISSSNNGKIVLVNGFGHIDVKNNSNYDLVTSVLNSDFENKGKLTINDFKFSSGEDATYKNLKQSDITDEFLAAHSGKYEASVGENSIVTSSNGITNGNGSWGEISSSTREDGAKVYTTTYKPGDDAYSFDGNHGYSGSHRQYVPRSWIVELFDGKKYVTVYDYNAPVYVVRNNPISVTFQGFETPQVNISSNGAITMNSSISAMNGDVNLSSNDSIYTNSISNVITANNINLRADHNIGQLLDSFGTVKPVQVEIMNNGTLTAKSNTATENPDIYINFPYGNISNADIVGKNVYLATANGDMSIAGKVFGLTADDLTLQANSISFDTSANDSNISIGTLSARAKDNVTVINKDNMIIKSIISENDGTITLESKCGSIFAASNTGTYSDQHIHGGDINLRSNINIGSEANPLKFAKSGIFNVLADQDIYLSSKDAIYVDLIKSTDGSVNVNADFGIIASTITDEDRVYNIYSKGNMNLYTTTGNIENLAINTDGVLNATAGFGGTESATGMSDIYVMMISKARPTEDDIEAVKNGTKSIEDLSIGTKDLRLGTIKASKNVTIAGERGVMGATSDSSVLGESITIIANGDVGIHDDPLTITANREISIASSDGSNVYLQTNDSEKGMKITSIDTHNNTGSLNNVVLTSAGNITNSAKASEVTATTDSDVDGTPYADEEQRPSKIANKAQATPNIRAKNITLHSDKNIGTMLDEDFMFIETTSADTNSQGLIYSATNAYVRGVGGELRVNSAIANNDNKIYTTNTKLSATEIKSLNGDVTINIDNADSNINEIKAANNIAIIDLYGNTNLKDLEADNITAMLDNMVISDGTVKANKLTLVGSKKAEIKNTSIEAKDSSATKVPQAKIVSPNGDIKLDTVTIGMNSELIAESGLVETIDTVIKEDTTITSKNAKIDSLTVDKDLDITTTEDTNISNATVGGDYTNNSNNTTVTGKLSVIGDAIINSKESVKIADTDIKQDLNIIATNAKIDEINLDGNLNANVKDIDVKTSNNLNLGTVKGNDSDYADNVKIDSTKSIVNGNSGASSDDANIAAKNISIKAGDSIGSKNNMLNVDLPKGNSVSVEAGNNTNINSTGAGPNYNKIKSTDTNIKSTGAIKIANIETNTLDITTKSTDVEITGNVETKGTIKTADKNVVIDNTGMQPYHDVTAQLHVTEKPMHLVIDSSNNIKTQAKNVTRHSIDMVVNGSNTYTSMEDEVTISAEVGIKNSNVDNKLIEHTDRTINEIPTVSDYISNIVNGYGTSNITNINGEMLNNTNIMDVINTIGETPNPDDMKKKAKAMMLNPLRYAS